MIGAGQTIRDVHGMPFIFLPTERVMIDGKEVEVKAFGMGKTEVTVEDYFRIMGREENQQATEYVLVTAECGRKDKVEDRQTTLEKLKKATVDGKKICKAEIKTETITTHAPSPPKGFDGPKQPMVDVDWHHAKRFCEKIGGSLPDENQWYRAALGPDKGYGITPKYPTNDGTLKCGVNAQCDTDGTIDVDDKKIPDDPFGFRHLTGNVSEWMINNAGRGNKRIRGGSWYDRYDWSLLADYRYYGRPVFHHYDLGFRCVVLPQHSL